MRVPSVGYVGDLHPDHAGYRLRIQAIVKHLNLNYSMDKVGDVTVIFRIIGKHFFDYIRRHHSTVIYDITNLHVLKNNILSRRQEELIVSCKNIVVSSFKMQSSLYENFRIKSTVIEDCYTNEEWTPAIPNQKILWFGHPSNLSSLKPFLKLNNLIVCSKNIDTPNLITYNEETELQLLKESGLVLLTSNNPMAGGNRIIRALRAGKFIITPNFNVESWNEFKDYIWQGDVEEGIDWALTHPQQALEKTKAGQLAIKERYSPLNLANQWRDYFIKVFNHEA